MSSGLQVTAATRPAPEAATKRFHIGGHQMKKENYFATEEDRAAAKLQRRVRKEQSSKLEAKRQATAATAVQKQVRGRQVRATKKAAEKYQVDEGPAGTL